MENTDLIDAINAFGNGDTIRIISCGQQFDLTIGVGLVAVVRNDKNDFFVDDDSFFDHVSNILSRTPIDSVDLIRESNTIVINTKNEEDIPRAISLYGSARISDMTYRRT